MWQSRRWRKLLSIIDNLPRNSAYHEALSNDEQLATLMLATSSGEPGPPTRRMREWSPPVELLTLIADRMTELIQTVGATRGAKPQQIRHQPRPVTALQRVRARKRKRIHNSLVSRMLPTQSEDSNR